MRKLILATLLACIAPAAAFGQQPPRTPLVADLLPAITVIPPNLERIQNRDSAAVRHRLTGPFQIMNAAEWDVIDVRVQCDWLAPSGFRLGNFEITLYATFPARVRGLSAPTNEREAPEQTVSIICAPRDLRIGTWRPPPPPPPAVAERAPGGISGELAARVACSLVDCPDRADIFPTCDCDLKENAVPFRPDPYYLVPSPPTSPEARRYLGMR